MPLGVQDWAQAELPARIPGAQHMLMCAKAETAVLQRFRMAQAVMKHAAQQKQGGGSGGSGGSTGGGTGGGSTISHKGEGEVVTEG